jgi:glycosyltransferase involved in cell wall biosynthesis
MGNSNPALVSVALCTYNGELFLGKQLDSILSQSYSPFELVIVDDNSTDATKDLIRSYQEKHSNIRTYFNEVNLGLNKNFERAISLCQGEYIAISDQDDIWNNDKIEKLVKNIGSDWVLFSNSETINFEDKSNGKLLINDFKLQDNYRSILLENFVTGHTCLLHRDILEYILPVPEQGFYDWWIGYVALYHHKLAYLNEVLTRYRVHTDSVIQSDLHRKSKIQSERTLKKQLKVFSEYKNLKSEDGDFLIWLRSKLDMSKNTLFNPLFVFLLKNYSQFFSRKADRSLLSKMNFLRKFFKKHL